MQISPINFYSYHINQTGVRNASKPLPIGFQGAKTKLISVNTASFDSATKMLYSKVQKYINLLGEEGSLKNIRMGFLYRDSEIYLSLNKGYKGINLRLSYDDPEYSDGVTLLDALFNRDGQMISGRWGNYKFERNNRNIRRIYYTDEYGESKVLPFGGDDKKWSWGAPIGNDRTDKEDPFYKIFVEWTRLHTSILK